jgi:hypothetical protein
MRCEAAINYIFLALFSMANDSQLFFLMETCRLKYTKTLLQQ